MAEIVKSYFNCGDCIHRMVCSNKEEYAMFLDETVWPDFLDMHVSCKYFREDYPTSRITTRYIPTSYIPKESK